MKTGRAPVLEHEMQLQLDYEQWSDTLEVMIYNDLDPRQKRDVGKSLTRIQENVVEQGRNKRTREYGFSRGDFFGGWDCIDVSPPFCFFVQSSVFCGYGHG